jgi:AcrR family transcriptional regulator
MPGTKAAELVRREQILTAAFEVAAREGLDGTTILQVAAAANVSPGLVMFHFKSKRGLLLALLDWMLQTTTVLHIDEAIAAAPTARERLLALLRQEMQRLSREPLRIRLTFDFWSAGIRDLEVQERLRSEFARYRAAFRPLAAAVLDDRPAHLPPVTADGLAAVAVSFIKGCAVQSMIDPEHFDIAEFLAAAETMIADFDGTARPRLAATMVGRES